MGLIMEEAATLMCPHAGQVQSSPSISRVTMGGLAPLAKDDTFSISGCPFMMGSSPHPCTEIQWLTATARVTMEGKEILLDQSSGLCKASDGVPQGPPNVIVTQQRVSAK